MATYGLEDMAQMLVRQSPGQMIENSLLLPTGQILTSSDQFLFIERIHWNSSRPQRPRLCCDELRRRSQLVSQARVTAADPEEVSGFRGLELDAHCPSGAC